MPARSLNSSVLKWPDAQTVGKAVRRWAQFLGRSQTDIARIAYIGSYARGDWGVGSDLDLIVVVDGPTPPDRDWATLELPVPADVLVYTLAEWKALAEANSRFYRTVCSQAVWVYVRDAAHTR